MGWINVDMKLGERCRKCPDRKIEPVNCHTTCEFYLNAKKEKEELEKKIKDARKNDAQYDNYKSKRVRETKEFIRKHNPKYK